MKWGPCVRGHLFAWRMRICPELKMVNCRVLVETLKQMVQNPSCPCIFLSKKYVFGIFLLKDEQFVELSIVYFSLNNFHFLFLLFCILLKKNFFSHGFFKKNLMSPLKFCGFYYWSSKIADKSLCILIIKNIYKMKF